MTLDDFTQARGEWLKGEGPCSDVVISSRIRLARNVKEFPFLATAGSTEQTEVFRLLTSAIANIDAGRDALIIDMEETDPLDCEILVERHLISQQHVAGEGHRGVTVSPDEKRAIMINEEDHLRIQGLRSGLQLESLWEDVNAIDDALNQEVEFAFDKQYGYLTACPTNVGTGIRVSVMLHLPALKMTREIERVARAARDMRLAVRGLHGEGTDSVGDFYQISNQTTLGKSESEIIRTFSDSIIPKIVEYERKARKTLLKHSTTQLDDKIWRAFGALAHARSMTNDETQGYLSPLRMGIHMERFKHLDIAGLNELFLNVQPAHLQKMTGRELADEERDEARADYLRKYLSNLN